MRNTGLLTLLLLWFLSFITSVNNLLADLMTMGNDDEEERKPDAQRSHHKLYDKSCSLLVGLRNRQVLGQHFRPKSASWSLGYSPDQVSQDDWCHDVSYL